MLPSGNNAVFVGKVSGTTLTVNKVLRGSLSLGALVLGDGIPPNTSIAAFGTGAGGVGTYILNNSQLVGPEQTMSSGIEVIAFQVNRVPQPLSPDFVLMSPISMIRLETNVTTYRDVAFVGSIAGTQLTVVSLSFGAIQVGQTLFGIGVVAGTRVTAFQSGTGGTGTYTVSVSQALSVTNLASGGKDIMQPTQLTIQLDVHGPNSADNAQVISTLFRDPFGVDFFATSGFDVTPFYADDPKQLPFTNGEQQYESRWVISAVMQANQVTGVPQQFADELEFAELTSVEAEYPIP